MFRRESFYSKFPKAMLGIEMVKTIYNRQKESSASEQTSRPLAIFTFFVNKCWFVGKEEVMAKFLSKINV